MMLSCQSHPSPSKGKWWLVDALLSLTHSDDLLLAALPCLITASERRLA